MSTVIKYNATSSRPVRPRTFELKDHVAQATALVEAARQRSQRIIEEAGRQAEAMRLKAAQEGYVSGHKKGYSEGRQAGHVQAFTEAAEQFQLDHEPLASALRSALEHVDAQKRDLLIHARQDLLELAFCIAERITRRLGELEPQVAYGNLVAACKIMGRRTDLVARVHPQDVATLRQFSATWTPAATGWEHITFVEDPSMHRGGCVVSTPEHEVDARLETQLEEIASLLLASRSSPVARQNKVESNLELDDGMTGDNS